ncbi:MAG: 2-phosphosulfolactate phosphatase [Candidatus Heimdallarchaeota archaeon]|nr:2-phosphosulfolactate phosphatase [Candidatus Heimdallarchaeota archaeon]
MSIEVILLGNAEGSNLASETTGSVAVIVDVLRASTTIPTAMRQGVKTFYVAKEVEDARQVKVELNTLLMGERGCLKLEGFDYGNSPVELSSKTDFSKKAAAFTSSTGAKRVVESIGAKVILIGSIVNAKAIAQKVIALANKDKNQIKAVIIPAFSEGCIENNTITEDQLGGLLIANEFQKLGVTLSKEISEEIAFLKQLLRTTTFYNLLNQTEHGKKLIKLGYSADIEFCSRLNSIDITPISRNDIITLANNMRVVKFSKE